MKIIREIIEPHWILSSSGNLDQEISEIIIDPKELNVNADKFVGVL